MDDGAWWKHVTDQTYRLQSVRFPGQSLCQFVFCGFQLAHQADAGTIPCLYAAADSCPIPKNQKSLPILTLKNSSLPTLTPNSHPHSLPPATKDPSNRALYTPHT